MKNWAIDLAMWGEKLGGQKQWRIICATGEKLWLSHQVSMDIHMHMYTLTPKEVCTCTHTNTHTHFDISLILISSTGVQLSLFISIIFVLLCMCSALNQRQIIIIYFKKWPHGLPKGRGGGGGKDKEFGISRCKLVCIGRINSKVLLYSTGNYIQYIVINHNEKEYEKEYIYICITDSLCCTAETNKIL